LPVASSVAAEPISTVPEPALVAARARLAQVVPAVRVFLVGATAGTEVVSALAPEALAVHATVITGLGVVAPVWLADDARIALAASLAGPALTRAVAVSANEWALLPCPCSTFIALEREAPLALALARDARVGTAERGDTKDGARLTLVPRAFVRAREEPVVRTPRLADRALGALVPLAAVRTGLDLHPPAAVTADLPAVQTGRLLGLTFTPRDSAVAFAARSGSAARARTRAADGGLRKVARSPPPVPAAQRGRPARPGLVRAAALSRAAAESFRRAAGP